jgi:DNA replication and repair protein RecF
VRLKNLYLRNFRNFKEEEISFDPHINIICGDNAQGKTNLLEAIAFISTGRSFRAQHSSELIYEGESFFYLEAEIIQNNVASLAKISFDGQNKKLQLGSTVYTTFQPLLGALPLILQAPSDQELITGPPNIRRRFFNLHLAQSDPLYVHHLIRYWRSMKQRNCLLRSKNQEAIHCWEEEMALSAAYLHKMRSTLTTELKAPLGAMSGALSGEKEIHEISYLPSFSDRYLQQLEKNRAREKELGFTILGPHRDDIAFSIGGKSARTFGSEGQKKTAIAALRLAEWQRLLASLNEPPIMAIDELGLPLDETRGNFLWNNLGKLGQVFITTPLANKQFEAAHHIPIQAGKLYRE